jgi:predicted nucleic acid-binding protein
MSDYFDTGVLLKLYTVEAESVLMQAFVRRRDRALPITEFHRAECTSALRLKQFRGEGTEREVTQALRMWDRDLSSGVLRLIAVDWNLVWSECHRLAHDHAGATGCRTLDTLHVASARVLGFRHFVTADRRQAALAQRAGLTVINPFEASG